MSTRAEIESAVDALPRPEQVSLLNHLTRRPAAEAPFDAEEIQRRQRWLDELRQLREETSTGREGIPLQQLMDEIREDRC